MDQEVLQLPTMRGSPEAYSPSTWIPGTEPSVQRSGRRGYLLLQVPRAGEDLPELCLLGRRRSPEDRLSDLSELREDLVGSLRPPDHRDHRSGDGVHRPGGRHGARHRRSEPLAERQDGTGWRHLQGKAQPPAGRNRGYHGGGVQPVRVGNAGRTQPLHEQERVFSVPTSVRIHSQVAC